MKHWRLDTDNQTLVLSSLDNRVPCLIYWGQKLPGDESLEDLIEASKKDWGDNLLDKFLIYQSFLNSLLTLLDSLDAR